MATDPLYRPIPEAVPARVKKRSIQSVVGVVVVAVAVAAGAFFAWRLLSGSAIRLPDSLAGTERLDIPIVEREIERFRDQMTDYGFEVDAAMYGTAGVPSFMVMVVNDSPGDGEMQDTIFDQFTSGFATGSSLQIDLARLEVTQVGDATLRCTGVTGGPEASMCMWVDSETVGFVIKFLQGVDPTRELTGRVRTEIQA